MLIDLNDVFHKKNKLEIAGYKVEKLLSTRLVKNII